PFRSLTSWQITTPSFNCQIHLHLRIFLVHTEEIEFGVDDLNFRWADQVCCGNRAFTFYFQMDLRGFNIMQFHADQFEIQHDLDNILANTWDGCKFVLYISNAHRTDRGTIKRR